MFQGLFCELEIDPRQVYNGCTSVKMLKGIILSYQVWCVGGVLGSLITVCICLWRYSFFCVVFAEELKHLQTLLCICACTFTCSPLCVCVLACVCVCVVTFTLFLSNCGV